MHFNSTHKQLAEITDEGLFERLASDILRIAIPQYAALAHPGVNEDGKTRKAPIDGVGFVPDSEPPHFITAQHTIGAKSGLRNKWLYEQPKNNRKTKTPMGDLPKTRLSIEAERKRSPKLKATLILTCNQEPDEDLIRDTYIKGREHGFEVDIWARSRLANFLDFNASGQALRRHYFGTDNTLLSKEVFSEICESNLMMFRPPDDQDAWVHCDADDQLSNFKKSLVLLAAPSGFGKSIASYKHLQNHIKNGGFGLVIPHDVIEDSISIVQAFDTMISSSEPNITRDRNILQFCSVTNPFIVVVEDINRAKSPKHLLRKLINWENSRSKSNSEQSVQLNWKIICPVWPDLLAATEQQLRKIQDDCTLTLKNLSRNQAEKAVIARAKVSDVNLSRTRAQEIAASLGNDHLLIALFDFSNKSRITSSTVIDNYLEDNLSILASESNSYCSEYRETLLELCNVMLAEKELQPKWRDVLSWSISESSLPLIREIEKKSSIFSLVKVSSEEHLKFRHDRVRDHLLVEALKVGIDNFSLDQEVVSDPYFAQILGAAYANSIFDKSKLDRLAVNNILAIFYVLKESEVDSDVQRAAICIIKKWLTSDTGKSSENDSLRWEAIAILTQIEHSSILEIIDLFPEKGVNSYIAGFRNGNLADGVRLCNLLELGLSAQFRDDVIDHVHLKYGANLTKKIRELLCSSELTNTFRRGLLGLVGYIGDNKMATSVMESWDKNESSRKHLEDYIWAASRTCDEESAEEMLSPMLAVWSSLSNKEVNGMGSPRSRLGSDTLRFAFSAHMPNSAINYLLEWSEQSDLQPHILYMLSQIDHPKVIEKICIYYADHAEKSPILSTINTHLFTDVWRRAAANGVRMSQSSRARLKKIWETHSQSKSRRLSALNTWLINLNKQDLETLKIFQADDVLNETILKHRVEIGDPAVKDMFISKLEANMSNTWLFLAANNTTYPEIAPILERKTTEWAKKHNATNNRGDEGRYLSNAIMRLKRTTAERILLENWDALKTSTNFIQTALYIASPTLLELVATAVRENDTPRILFEHITSHYGIYVTGQPGITRREQISALKPYLKLMDPICYSFLAKACNDNAWWDIRAELLDSFFDNQKFVWKKSNAYKGFDEMMERNPHSWINSDIDHAATSGISWHDYFQELTRWYLKNQNFNALHLMCEAITYKGNRRDLHVLDSCLHTDDETKSLIASTIFTVKRRTMQ